MLYRIAVGAGLFLLGYALGRRVRNPASKPELSGTSRIRDTLSEQMEEPPEQQDRRTAEPGPGHTKPSHGDT